MMSSEMRTNITIAHRMGDVMARYFERKDIGEHNKTDNTVVTDADLAISDEVVDFFRSIGRSVVSEEQGGTAQYGALNAEYLDPIDGTYDFCQSRELGKQSLAAFSLGSVIDGQMVRGVVDLPLIKDPCLYYAEIETPSFRIDRKTGEQKRIEVAEDEKGIVLVSTNHHAYIGRLAKMGFETIGLDGAVFKACSVADPELISRYSPQLQVKHKRVVGFVSTSAQPHDYVAAAVIARSADGIACGLDGGELNLSEGKHGCVFANNIVVKNLLLESVEGHT